MIHSWYAFVATNRLWDQAFLCIAYALVFPVMTVCAVVSTFRAK